MNTESGFFSLPEAKLSKILIVTCHDDDHALFVAAALHLRGDDVVLWHTTDYPTQENRTFSIGSHTQSAFVINGAQPDISITDFDSIWWRRPRAPNLAGTEVHADDRRFLFYVNRAYNNQILEYFGHIAENENGPAWANDPNAARKAESKFVQLQCAVDAGWNVPETLISNSKTEILKFISGRISIRKSFITYSWRDGDSLSTNYTSKIDTSDIVSNSHIEKYSEIYQSLVDKTHEIRVVFFGSTYFAIKMNRLDESDEVDFRSLHKKKDHLEMVDLTDRQYSLCMKIMKKLKLVTATIEFMVDSDGTEWFAEVNQAGQFLWPMRHFPDVPILDAFVEFIRKPSSEFRYSGSKNPLRLDDVRESDVYKKILVDDNKHKPFEIYGRIDI